MRAEKSGKGGKGGKAARAIRVARVARVARAEGSLITWVALCNEGKGVAGWEHHLNRLSCSSSMRAEDQGPYFQSIVSFLGKSRLGKHW